MLNHTATFSNDPWQKLRAIVTGSCK